MPKTYLRYVPSSVTGVICSAGLLCDSTGEVAICGALESVNLWHLKRGTLYAQLKDPNNKSEVTALAISPDKITLAAGYLDGSVRLFSLQTRTFKTSLTGHRSAVTCMRFNKDGTLLVTGSNDTTLIVWDTVTETGLYKLKGHRDVITDCVIIDDESMFSNIAHLGKLENFETAFNNNKGSILVSASKDSLVKIWDLETQHCIQTIVGHRNEVWCCEIDPVNKRVVTGSVDERLRIFSYNTAEFSEIHDNLVGTIEENNESVLNSGVQEDNSDQEQPSNDEVVLKFIGSVERQGTRDRVHSIRFNAQYTLMGIQTQNTVEIYNVHDQNYRKYKRQRRQQKWRRKQKQSQIEPMEESEDEAPENLKNFEVSEKLEEKDKSIPDIYAKDEFSLRVVVTAAHNIKSFSFTPDSKQVVMALTNNKIETVDITDTNKKVSIEQQGHRAGIRDMSLSSDDQLLLTASNGACKIWNVATRQCIRSLKCGYALCASFIPGNKYAVVGTKEGNLEIVDVPSATVVETVQAHTGAIWGLDVRPDKTGLVTGGADHDVKFWSFELVSDEESKGAKRLTLTLMRTLKMSDDVMAVKFSPDRKYVAVSLLDNTVKIFHEDSLTFFLSLFGHKLPVLYMDISSDSQLIVTCSSDKNIKIWGMDFGDCHKSIFAHDDSITQVKFVKDTHYVWTVSKDKTVKCWDADKFENIQILQGHHNSVWCLCISQNGHFVVSASEDKSIRFWERTDEQIFLDEERENQLEAMFENVEEGRQSEPFGLEDKESAPAGRRTLDTLKAGERLLEAIEAAEEEKQKQKFYEQELQEAEVMLEKTNPKELAEKKANGRPLIPQPNANPLLMGLTPADYVLRTLKGIRANDMDEALSLLPFGAASNLLLYTEEWLKKQQSVELVCRVLFFIVQNFNNQIVSNSQLLNHLLSIRECARTTLQGTKDVIGFNKSGMNILKRNMEQDQNAKFFEDSLIQHKKKKQSKKRS